MLSWGHAALHSGLPFGPLISSSPPVILPAPSAVKLPATATCRPLASATPLKRKAYWPLSAGVTVMVVLAVLVVSATEVAVSVTFKSLADEVVGAVNVTAAPLPVAVGETEPHGVAEHDTIHVTPLPAESLLTVAVNCAVAPGCTVAVACDSVTLTVGGGGGGGTLAEPPPHPELLTATTRAISIAISERPFSETLADSPLG